MSEIHTLSGNLRDVIPGGVSSVHNAYLLTNVPDDEALIGTGEDGGVAPSNVGRIPLAGDAFSLPLLATDSTDLNVASNTLRYRVHVEYGKPGIKGLAHWYSDWFELTDDADLKTIIGELELVPPSTRADQLAERIDGGNDHGDVSGTLTLDADTGTHVIDATGHLLVILDPDAPDFRTLTLLVTSGADNVTIDGTDTTPTDGVFLKFVRIRGAWLLAALSGTGDPVDPPAPVYDVIVVAGQSNAAGRGYVDPTLDARDPRVWQYASAGAVDASRRNTITAGDEPLGHPEQESGGLNGLGPAHTFASAYADAYPDRQVLLVPAAYGGTGFSSGSPNNWTDTAGSLYRRAIAQANAAMVAAGTGARLAAILWVQGEADTGMTSSAYRTALDALITGMRADIAGASDAPFVIGRMTPGFIASGAGPAAIDAVHVDTPNRLDNIFVVAGPTGQDDGLHYNSTGYRALGESMFDAIAPVTAAPNPPTGLAKTSSTTTSITIGWTAPTGGGTVTGYDVRINGGTPSAKGNLTSTTLTGLTASTSYTIEVRATGPDGSSSWVSLTASTSAAPAAPFTDDFNRADSASVLGNGWAALSGTFGIASNAAVHAAGTGTSPWSLAVKNCAADGTASVKLGDNLAIGLAYRVVDANNYLAIRFDGTGSLQCFKVVAGSTSSIGDFSITPVTFPTTLSVVMSGANVTVKVNGTTVTTLTPGVHETGAKAGLWGVNPGPATFDDFSYTP